jgi:CRISPR system Cascade subunit CasB
MIITKVETHSFIAHLEKLVNEQDLGALANLRRGLGKPPGTAREMDRYVLRYVPYGVKEAQENAYYLIASLFACWYQGKDAVNPNPPENLGTSLHALVKKNVEKDKTNRNYEDKWKDAEKSIEKRLVALLNSHQDDLPKHLQHTISLLKSKDIPVNWSQLLHDVQNWHSENHEVQRRWARGFWRNFNDSTNSDLRENKKL